MTDKKAFLHRLKSLNMTLKHEEENYKSRSGDYSVGEELPIERLRQLVREAEECYYDLLPSMDDGKPSEAIMELAYIRQRSGIMPYEPIPSEMKVGALCALHLARFLLASSLYPHSPEEAVLIYRELVDLTILMRTESWYDNDLAYQVIDLVGDCYFRYGDYEAAIEWYQKGLDLIESDGLPYSNFKPPEGAIPIDQRRHSFKEGVNIAQTILRKSNAQTAEEEDTFLQQLNDLKDKAEKEETSSTVTPHVSIGLLQETHRKAEECFSRLQDFDNGLPSKEVLFEVKKRKLRGQPCEHVPSEMKLLALNALEISRKNLAAALQEAKRYEEAISVYKKLLDQRLRMRLGDWEDPKSGKVEYVMNEIAVLHVFCGKQEEATSWYKKGLRMAERDGIQGSEIEKILRYGFSCSMAGKAGPAFGTAENESTQKAWKKCWSCGKTGGPECRLLQCAKCDKVKNPTPAYYCSSECQKKDWDRHKLYHMETKERGSLSKVPMVDFVFCGGRDVEGNENWDTTSKPQGVTDTLWENIKECKRLNDTAYEHMQQGDLNKARRLLQKSIKLCPDLAEGHFNLTVLYGASGNYEGMMQEYAEVMRQTARYKIGEPYSRYWARSVLGVWSCYQVHGAACSSIPKPDWLLDPDQFLAVAQRAVKIEPEISNVWGMLGSAHEGKGNLDKAAKFYKKAGRDSEQFRAEAGRVKAALERK